MNRSAFQKAVAAAVRFADNRGEERRENRKTPRRMRRILAAKDAARREAKLTEVVA